MFRILLALFGILAHSVQVTKTHSILQTVGFLQTEDDSPVYQIDLVGQMKAIFDDSNEIWDTLEAETKKAEEDRDVTYAEWQELGMLMDEWLQEVENDSDDFRDWIRTYNQAIVEN